MAVEGSEAERTGRNDLDAALNHARDLFVYHATQRHQSLRFYILALAAIIAGFGGLISASFGIERQISLFVLAVVFLFVNGIFSRLDKRNAELVQNNERSLIELEQLKSKQSGLKSFNMTARGDEPTEQTYSKLMPRFFGFFRFLGYAAVVLTFVWLLLLAIQFIGPFLESA